MPVAAREKGEIWCCVVGVGVVSNEDVKMLNEATVLGLKRPRGLGAVGKRPSIMIESSFVEVADTGKVADEGKEVAMVVEEVVVEEEEEVAIDVAGVVKSKVDF